MVHWGWLVAAFVAGLISGSMGIIVVSCCVLSGKLDKDA